VFEQFKAATDHKPFLSTEVCLNASEYQHDSYRLALSMAQLYHKNLALGDAVALCYCWTLLNVVQPSYGATRSLCVPDESNDMMPKASSNQLRTFGAFSRHIRKGMKRLATICDHPDVLATAFKGSNGTGTLVAVNRSTTDVSMDIGWLDVKFNRCEIADPYHGNTARASGDDVRSHSVTIPAGAIVTLTNVHSNDR